MSLQQNSDTELRRKLRKLSRGGVRPRATLRKKRADNEAKLRRLVHDLQVHQIELEVQNRELREAQAELEASRNEYAELYDFAPVGYVDFDQHGVVQQINLTGAELLGRVRSRIVGKPFSLFVNPFDGSKFSQHIRNCWKAREKQSIELELRKNRGGRVFVQVSTIAVRTADDREWICRSVLTDVAERKRSEAEKAELLVLEQQSRSNAEKERARFETVIRQMPAGVVIADAATQKIIFSNEQFNQICGVRGHAGDALANGEVKFFRADGRPYDQETRPIFRALRNGEIISRERASLVRGDGSRAVVEIAAAPIRERSGEISSAVATIHDITQQQQLESQLRGAHEELEARVKERTTELAQAIAALEREAEERKQAQEARQQLFRELATAQEEERRRISRELHDEMGQHLTALILGLKALEGSLKADPGKRRLKDLQKLSDEIGRQVHRIALELRPTALDDLGLQATVINYLDDWAVRFGLTVDFHSGGLEKERLPTEIETTIYRIVQEALTNVVKHAQATHLSVILVRRQDHLLTIIEDDGKGFDADAVIASHRAYPHRLGLHGIKERVALAGGTFQLESTEGKGTTLFIRIPLMPPQSGNETAKV